MAKNKIIISIAGSELIVMTEESREYTTRLANIIDMKMRELLASSSKVTTPMASILTSLDLCDENEKNKAAAARLRDEIKSYYERNIELEDKLDKMRQENEILKRRLGELR